MGANHKIIAHRTITADELSLVRVTAEAMALDAGLDNERARRFALAVHELATNSVAYAGSSGELTVVQDDRRMVYAEVADHGPGIGAPLDLTAPSPDALRGRGLWLSYQLSDRMFIETGSNGTTIRVEFESDPTVA